MKEQVIRSAIGLAIFLAGALAAVVFLCYGSVSTQSVIWIGIITGVAVLGYGILGTAHPAYARSMAMFMGGIQLCLFVPIFATMGEPSALDAKEWIHGLQTMGIVSVILTITIMAALRTQWIEE